MEGFAFLGGVIGGVLGLAGAIVGARQAAKRQKKAAREERKAILQAENKAAEEYRQTLRGNARSRGSGSFRMDGTAQPFVPSLKQLTGQ